MEAAYRAGHISVLMATSTLAAGINLPAKRVILRSLWQARPLFELGACLRHRHCLSVSSVLLFYNICQIVVLPLDHEPFLQCARVVHTGC